MRFWVARGTPTHIKEQLISQLLLAIFSGRFAHGARLPSVRQLARGWVEHRPGSGVYVRPQLTPPTLHSLIERFLAEASAAAELSVQWNEPIGFAPSAGRLPEINQPVYAVRLVSVEEMLVQPRRHPSTFCSRLSRSCPLS